MRAVLGALLLAASAPLLAESPPTVVRIINRTGPVNVRVADVAEPQLRGSSPTRETRGDDCQFGRHEDALILLCEPLDGAEIAVDVEVPFGYERIQVKTDAGDVRLAGFAPSVDIITETGDVDLTMPWIASRIEVFANEQPKPLELPDNVKFKTEVLKRPNGQRQWYLEDRLKDELVTRGDVKVNLNASAGLTLRDMEIPADAPWKPHWLAERVLPRLLEPVRVARRRPRAPGATPGASSLTGDDFTFRSDVRMVNHIAAVYDLAGTPVAGLDPDEFQVLENGEPQELVYAAIESTPFNLAIFLDLSHSTAVDRDAMAAAARGFLGTVQDGDRVAVYALARESLQVLQPLTANRAAVERSLEAIPKLSGQSPVYDVVTLAYAEELHARPGERNAMILITDGLDNQFAGVGTPSTISFRRSLELAGKMNALLYPVIIDHTAEGRAPSGQLKTGWSNLEKLADASGGEVFRARSIHDLDPVYEQVEEQLRAVYSLAYYPSDQEFDGGWRRVEVSVPGRRVAVRGRNGYLAK